MKPAMWVTIVLAATACGMRKQHVIDRYGESYDAALRAQAKDREPPAVAITGLDSQEAAIISDTYRTALAPKEAKPEEQPVLIVTPQPSSRGEMPPPSVPKE